jgi:hypothetical protein
MEADKVFRQYRDRQGRFHARIEEIRARTNSILEGLEHQMPSEAIAAQLDGLRRELERLFRDNLEQAGTFIEHLRNVKESNRRSQVAEKRSAPQQSQSQIKELSEELNTNLRLDRIDKATKELLDFLADAEFFAANSPTGRRRRLRTLQNAIEKSLQK